MRRIALTAALAALAGATAAQAPFPNARASEPRANAQRRDAAQSLAEKSGAERAAATKAAAAQASREIADLRRQLVALGAAEHLGERRVGSDRAQRAVLNAREAELNRRIDANRVQLARLLGALENYRRDPPPALLVDPRSAKDAVRAAILLRGVVPAMQARARAFRQQADDLARVRRGAAMAGGDLIEAESAIADRRGRIERLIADKRALERRLYADAAQAEAEARRLGARAGSVGELVTAVAAHDPGAGAGLGGDAPTHLSPPVQGVVERRWGEPWPGRGRSQGWSWRALPGAVVLSPADGRVDYIGPLKDWGGVAILQLGGGRRLVLAGLQTASVGIGRTVAAGEPIGRLPDLRGAPAELYLELRDGGRSVDPGPLLSPGAVPVPHVTNTAQSTPSTP